MTDIKELLELLATWVQIAGGVWGTWGIVQTGLGMSSHDGSGIRNGLLQIVGAGLIIAGAGFLKTIV